MTQRLTNAEIEAAMTPKGGWTRETLAAWGVPWPPPKGWRKRLTLGPPEGTQASATTLYWGRQGAGQATAMTTDLREKLIASVQALGLGCCQYAGDRDVAAQAVDAVLDGLLVPDEAMIEAGDRALYFGVSQVIPEPENVGAAFAAMIKLVKGA